MTDHVRWKESELEDHYTSLKQQLGKPLRQGVSRLGGPPPCVVTAADEPEDLIQEECTKQLEQDGWRALRTDPVSDRSRGKGFGEPGMADYMYIRYSDLENGARGDDRWAGVIWIEYKRSKGGRVSKTQRAWHIKERARGALTLIAGEDFPASVAGFKEWYKASGLQRRRDG